MHEKFRDGRLVFLNTPGSGDSLTLNPEDGQVRHGGGIDHFGFRAEAGIIAER
jgi:hypothetical protein